MPYSSVIVKLRKQYILIYFTYSNLTYFCICDINEEFYHQNLKGTVTGIKYEASVKTSYLARFGKKTSLLLLTSVV
jgi:hypothetical protein